MHGLTVGEEYNAQIAAVHLRDCTPTPYPAILLDLLARRVLDHALNPLETDGRAVRTLADYLKVPSEPHNGDSTACQNCAKDEAASALRPTLNQRTATFRWGPNGR